MYVLVPIDGSKPSTRALSFAVDLVANFDGTLDVVHVGDPDAEPIEQLLDRAREQCAAAGVDATVEAVPEPEVTSRMQYATKVGSVILDLAGERDVDHLVMGSHGREGVDEFVLGSAVGEVLGAHDYPVTVIP